MAIADFFKEVFDELATDGVMGDPQGQPAYGLIRVSSAGQSEEGRSGLPRQIMHLHEAAAKHGLKIPWELVFADDHSGFEFKNRPELSRLRAEYKSAKRRANSIVIENLDRLSRNADWHQGFLLDEMNEYGLNVIFWKAFSSRIERAVIGAISQEGMEQEKQRMMEGTRFKARSGRITAKWPAYGYVFVDSDGNPGEKAKKDTHYAPHPEQAEIVSLIFTKYAVEGRSLRSLTTYLEEHFPPPGRAKHWEISRLVQMMRNPVYKGEFAAHRSDTIKVPKERQRPGEPVQYVSRTIIRPQEEWITVPVPAIVSPDLWEMANRMLAKNAQMSRRNAKEPYLLTGLVKCAFCTASYVGNRSVHKTGAKGQQWRTFHYRCVSHTQRARHIREAIGCPQGSISCGILDQAIWSVICRIFLDPDALIDSLERDFHGGENAQLGQEIGFLERAIADKEIEDEKLYRAYQADVFDEHEYAARRKLIKQSSRTLEGELAGLKSRIVTPDQLEERKQLIFSLARHTASKGLVIDAPFETKQHILKLVVDKIVLNTSEKWFRVEGIIRGQYFLGGDAIENNSAHIDSPPQSSFPATPRTQTGDPPLRSLPYP